MVEFVKLALMVNCLHVNVCMDSLAHVVNVSYWTTSSKHNIREIKDLLNSWILKLFVHCFFQFWTTYKQNIRETITSILIKYNTHDFPQCQIRVQIHHAWTMAHVSMLRTVKIKASWWPTEMIINASAHQVIEAKFVKVKEKDFPNIQLDLLRTLCIGFGWWMEPDRTEVYATFVWLWLKLRVRLFLWQWLQNLSHRRSNLVVTSINF